MTLIKPELSKKNKYWIEKHRYHELKHFCLQYDIFKKAYSSLDGLSKDPVRLEQLTDEYPDPTAAVAVARNGFSRKMEIIEQAAIEADPDLYTYILIGVTENLTYDKLNARLTVPCCRDVYYATYRKFFYILNKLRD